MRPIAVALMFLPSAALAEPQLVARYGPVAQTCYHSGEDAAARRACVGLLSQACMAGEDGGETTLGMSICLNSETEFWDGLLNDEYRQTMEWARAADDDEAEYFPEFANRVSTLRDAQRAWIAFRDAECALDYAVWGAGSMRHIAGNDCLMNLTAQRTIQLRSKRELMQ